MASSDQFLELSEGHDTIRINHTAPPLGNLHVGYGDLSYAGYSPPQPYQYTMNSNLPLHITPQYQLSDTSPPLQLKMEWNAPPLPNYDYPLEDTFYAFSSPNQIGIQKGWLLGEAENAYRPRRLQSAYNSSMLELGPQATPAFFSQDNLIDNQCIDYVTTDGTGELSRLSISQSPDASGLRAQLGSADFRQHLSLNSPSCKSDDCEDEHDRLSNSEERATDEPYARLIHRALMEAPGHAMVLQEIYHWFERNTDKGKSKSTGWRNSIRHNLSMNAAFRKTDRKPPGEDIKKTSEWVLEDFAIKDGVTPTTRYRKQNNNKKTTRSYHAATARQGVTHPGGSVAARSRSLPKSKPDSKAGINSRAHQRRRESPARYSVLSYPDSRHISPSTPASRDVMPLGPGPFYFKHSADGIPHDMTYSFDDVSGVCLDDGPLFYSSDEHLHLDGHSHLWSNYHFA